MRKFFSGDPKAKILIHCGYGHILESEGGEWEKAMAGRLKEDTGIDPFTIDQEVLTEKSSTEFENPYYQLCSLNYDAVFLDSSGHPFNAAEVENSYDVNVYHPRTHWKSGRPDWIFLNDRKALYINHEIQTNFPCLVMAFIKEECDLMNNDYDNLIPFDIIELKSIKDKKALSLKKGNYEILVRDSDGITQLIQKRIK